MNLKKTLFSTLAAIAVVGSLVMPAVADDVTQTTTATTSVTEEGAFTLTVAGPITLGSASVSSLAGSGESVTHSVNHHVTPNDFHATSDGYTLTMSATDFKTESGGYFIDNAYLSFARQGYAPMGSCLAAPQQAQPPQVEGGNDYQSVTVIAGNGATYNLGGDVQLVDAGPGRGCLSFTLGLRYTLNVPAGTFTDGGSAQYTSTLTFTTVQEP